MDVSIFPNIQKDIMVNHIVCLLETILSFLLRFFSVVTGKEETKAVS